MKVNPLKCVFLILAILLLSAVMLHAGQKRLLTTTLLPTVECGKIAEGVNQGLLWIQTQPKKQIDLEFDLSRLPDDLEAADFKLCALRLVAQNVVYMPERNPHTGGGLVIVKGRRVGDDSGKTIISLSTLSKTNPVAMQVSEPLCGAAYQAYDAGKPLRLTLFSESHKAGTLVYSSEAHGNNPSNLPRLVIQYALGPPSLLETLNWPQHQRNPEHTGRTAWRPFKPPTGYTVEAIPLPEIDGQTPTIVDYPLIYQGTLIVVAKALAMNYLTVLDVGGRWIWKAELGEGTVQRPPVISRNGLYYVVFEKEIVAYDLLKQGRRAASFSLSQIQCDTTDPTVKLSTYTDLTIGNDGTLVAAVKACDNNYIYAFTPDLKAFIASGPFGAGRMKISTVSVGPDGGVLFAQSPQGGVVIDIFNPSRAKTIALKDGQTFPQGYYHTPLAGPIDGAMIFTDFSGRDIKGNVWGTTPAGINWHAEGSLVSQPVLGANEHVYFVQNDRLQGYRYDQSGDPEIKSRSGLNTTSNLVMDGGDNIYFWDNGWFNGYTAKGKAMFDSIDMTGIGPEKNLRLMLGPDGTLWANNKSGSALFAFKPQYPSAEVHLSQADMQTHTVYRATGALDAGSVLLADRTQTIMQAGQGISFSNGFSVDKGASLLCRTGF